MAAERAVTSSERTGASSETIVTSSEATIPSDDPDAMDDGPSSAALDRVAVPRRGAETSGSSDATNGVATRTRHGTADIAHSSANISENACTIVVRLALSGPVEDPTRRSWRDISGLS